MAYYGISTALIGSKSQFIQEHTLFFGIAFLFGAIAAFVSFFLWIRLHIKAKDYNFTGIQIATYALLVIFGFGCTVAGINLLLS